MFNAQVLDRVCCGFKFPSIHNCHTAIPTPTNKSVLNPQRPATIPILESHCSIYLWPIHIYTSIYIRPPPLRPTGKWRRPYFLLDSCHTSYLNDTIWLHELGAIIAKRKNDKIMFHIMFYLKMCCTVIEQGTSPHTGMLCSAHVWKPPFLLHTGGFKMVALLQSTAHRDRPTTDRQRSGII